MEMNPLPIIINATKKDMWYSFSDIAYIICIRLAGIGFNFATTADVARCVRVFVESGFLDADLSDDRCPKFKVKDHFYDLSV